MMRLSVIVPAYNEESRVGDLVKLLQERLAPLGDAQEIIVVDDGSTDGTAEQVVATGARLLRHEVNAGKAAAVQTGLATSTGAFVAVLDADLEYFPDDLVPMLERAEASSLDGSCAEIAVYGSRYLQRENFAGGVLGRLRMLVDKR